MSRHPVKAAISFPPLSVGLDINVRQVLIRSEVGLQLFEARCPIQVPLVNPNRPSASHPFA
jgi:hypothetical protein